MVQRICPYCRCEDSRGRETNASRPYSYLGPTPTEVYAAVFEFYTCDRSVLNVDSRDLVQNLLRLGCLNSMPSLVDVGYAQELIREVERSQIESSQGQREQDGWCVYVTQDS
jgi:hypothetical protein